MQYGARQVVEALQAAGHTAYWVGGCVRDRLLGQTPLDYDIATSALPEQVLSLFPSAQGIGKAFGVVLVRLGQHRYEVATFRTEGVYRDGRRPESVQFSTGREDAQRRDFTMNGIFYDPVADQYHDFVGGIPDLHRGLLRCIGDSHQRLQEDHLRVLRAVRFRSRFSLEYAPETARALERHGSLLIDTVPERLMAELKELLLHPSRGQALRDMQRFGIGERLLPELWACEHTPQPADHHQEGSVLEHSILSAEKLRPGVSLPTVWATLLHDIGKAATYTYTREGPTSLRYPDHAAVGAALAERLLSRLRAPRGLLQAVRWLVYHHHIFDQWPQMSRATQLQYYDHPLFASLLELHRADILGSIPQDWGDRPALQAQLERLQEEYYALQSTRQLPQHLPPLLTGEEIMRLLGLERGGPLVGEVQEQLRTMQLEGTLTTADAAQRWVADYMAPHEDRP